MNPLSDWLTTKEAAQETGYNVEHIRRLVRQGRLMAQKMGRDWVIERSSLFEYIQNEGNGPQPREKIEEV